MATDGEKPSAPGEQDAPEFTAPEPYFPERFKRLVEIEEKIIASVDLCADTMDELSKMGQANKDTTAKICQQFLENMRDVKSELHQMIITTPTLVVNKTSDYAAKFAHHAADNKVQVALERLSLIEAALAGSKADDLLEKQEQQESTQEDDGEKGDGSEDAMAID